MAEGKVLSESAYSRLVEDIRKLIVEGRARAQKAAGKELVQTYWAIGGRISEEGLTGNASYGGSIIEDLSEELGVDVDTLYRAVHFFKAYKVAPRGDYLSWSHYKALLGVKDPDARKRLEDRASKEDWNILKLDRAIRAHRESGSKAGSPLRSKRFSRPVEPTYLYKAEVLKVVDADTFLVKLCSQFFAFCF